MLLAVLEWTGSQFKWKVTSGLGQLRIINPKMDMQKVVALDDFGVRADPRNENAWALPRPPATYPCQ